jgi:hypothetical protein
MEEASGGPDGRGRRKSAYRDLLTLEVGGGKILPLFGSESEASDFAELHGSRTGQPGWSSTQAWAGELLMLFSASGSGVGPCSGVSAVTFDPPAEAAKGEYDDLRTLGVRCFMDQLLGRGGRWSQSR